MKYTMPAFRCVKCHFIYLQHPNAGCACSHDAFLVQVTIDAATGDVFPPLLPSPTECPSCVDHLAKIERQRSEINRLTRDRSQEALQQKLNRVMQARAQLADKCGELDGFLADALFVKHDLERRVANLEEKLRRLGGKP